MKNKIICLIPARSGSKRIKDKNIINLKGKPLIYYTINIAKKSKIFDKIIVSTDSKKYKKICESYGVKVIIRPKKISNSDSPDIEWIKHSLKQLNTKYKYFFILRPTSPFRKVSTLKKAWKQFKSGNFHSLRSVQKSTAQPGKMWVIRNKYMFPLLPFLNQKKIPWHSCQSFELPEVFLQDASLEIGNISKTIENNTIAGEIISPFINNSLEGFDINTPEDLELAKKIIENNKF